jgi:hypothetical protein
MTISLRPAVAVSSGFKLLITLVGQPLITFSQPPLVNVTTPTLPIISFSRHMPPTIEFVFNAELSNAPLVFTFGTFAQSPFAVPEVDYINAAILNELGDVIAASSQGSFPPIFSSVMSNSSVQVSSYVANARNVSVSVAFTPTSKIFALNVTGLPFVDFVGTSGSRRLLQSGASCTNLLFSGALAVTFRTIYDVRVLSLRFPAGGALPVNPAIPCVCQISGFRNPAAAPASPSVMISTYESTGAGAAMQSGVVFPPILCEPGYLQSSSGDSSVNCAPCSRGTFSDTPGSGQCTNCPLGTYSETVTATSISSCTPCPPATFSNISGLSELSACRACPAGTNSSIPGAVACKPCESGSFTEKNGQQLCDLCPAGTYGQQQGASSRTACRVCASGTFSRIGSTICSRCPPGTSSEPGSKECQPCGKGEYSENGDQCLRCPGIRHSLVNGSTSLSDCSGIRVNIGGSTVAYNIGITVFIIYIISFSLVPSWSASDTVMRFKLTSNFQGRLQKNEKAAKRRRASSWYERVQSVRSGSLNNVDPTPAAEKRFFHVGDSVHWRGQEWASNADAFVGTIESTSVYPGQDADDFGDFDAFVKIHPSFLPIMQRLQESADSTEGEKPVLIDPLCSSCRCQLKKAPASHARLLKWTVGPWEKVRQINACFQLLLMSFFPAIDTISDLVYILSSVFANPYLFVASLLFITSQFWFFVNRLTKRRVFEAFKARRIDLKFVQGWPFWPKWASPDNLFVFLFMILPLYFFFHIIFPIVWFLLGYALYSFQLFPISRISNRWLYAFV